MSFNVFSVDLKMYIRCSGNLKVYRVIGSQVAMDTGTDRYPVPICVISEHVIL